MLIPHPVPLQKTPKLGERGGVLRVLSGCFCVFWHRGGETGWSAGLLALNDGLGDLRCGLRALIATRKFAPESDINVLA